MPDVESERGHLARAERDIAEGEARISRQAELVARLQAEGQRTEDAEALLRNFRETLQAWKAHRGLILRVIADPER